jgi:Cu(I)/Ag(I) efflux system membrane fusion protein
MRVLGRSLRASGRIEVDERRVVAVTPKFEGYVERLHVNVTGQAVASGQPLFDVYSPELVAAQREYAIAVQGLDAMKGAGTEARGGMRQLAEASLEHLRHWGLSPDQLAALVQTGQTQRTVSFVSPVSGIVTEKKALQGMRFMPGDTLYQITDLSSIWVVADVFEQDIGQVRIGAKATVRVDAYPGEAWTGRIAYVYPLLKPETRTIPVRVELVNPGLRLKPAMYAQIELGLGGATPVLTVPESAVIDSGTRRIVLVQTAPGRFEPREVDTGERSGDWVELRRGVREGEQVVVAANFLIDAESNLKAVIGNLGGIGAPGIAAPASAGAAGPVSALQAPTAVAGRTARPATARPAPASGGQSTEQAGEHSAEPPPMSSSRAASAHVGH